jgi:hypothetical protein
MDIKRNRRSSQNVEDVSLRPFTLDEDAQLEKEGTLADKESGLLTQTPPISNKSTLGILGLDINRKIIG